MLFFLVYAVLLYGKFSGEFAADEETVKNRWIHGFLNFFSQNRSHLLSSAMVILAIFAVDIVNEHYSLSIPHNKITGVRERAEVLSVDNSFVIQNGPL